MPVASKRRTQAERREAGRSALIESSIACLSEKGFAGTTFQDIIKRANCTTGQIQHHFGSKYGLYIAVLNQLLDEFKSEIERFPDRDSDIEARCHQAIGILTGLYTSERYAAVHTLVLGAQHNPELRDMIAQQRRGALALTRQAWIDLFSDTDQSDDDLLALLDVAVGVLRDFHFNKTIDVEEARVAMKRNITRIEKLIAAELTATRNT